MIFLKPWGKTDMPTKLPSGNWRGKVRVPKHLVEEIGKKFLSETFTKRIPARRWESQTKEKLENMIITPKENRVILSKLIDRYMEEYTPNKKSHRSEKEHLRIVSEHLGHMIVSDLTPKIIVQYAKMRLKTVCSDTVRKDLNKLSVLLNTYMALGDITLPANPVYGAKAILKVTKTLGSVNKRDRRPTENELKIFFASHIADLVEFTIETAMRRGELANMRRKHIDFKNDVLFIPETKDGGERTIPLTERAVEILISIGADKKDFNELIWGYRPDSITQAFGRICKQNNIIDLRFHDLRREGASRFTARGYTIQEVSVITGHADWKSLKIYTHLDPKEMAKKMRQDKKQPEFKIIQGGRS